MVQEENFTGSALFNFSTLTNTRGSVAIVISLNRVLSHLGPCLIFVYGRPYLSDQQCFFDFSCMPSLFSIQYLCPFPVNGVVVHSGMLCYGREIDLAISCVLRVLVLACPHPQRLTKVWCLAVATVDMVHNFSLFVHWNTVLNSIAHIPLPFVGLSCYTKANWSHHSPYLLG